MSIRDALNDEQNGMTESDMEACLKVAKARREVITFRSTGPWAKRWIEREFPTKGFHVKGKSSDWGPQAGLVPYLGEFSKVGATAADAVKGTAFNDHGIHDGAAKAVPLLLTAGDLEIQLQQEAEGKTALKTLAKNGSNVVMTAVRTGDNAEFTFVGKPSGTRDGEVLYAIHFTMDARIQTRGQKFNGAPGEQPMLVMTTTEDMTIIGGERPMTGDYDLMTICPRFEDFGKALGTKVGHGAQDGIFSPGQGMDRVMDTRLATRGGGADYYQRMKGYENAVLGKTMQASTLQGAEQLRVLNQREALTKQIDTLLKSAAALDSAAAAHGNHRDDERKAVWLEHKDMGNLTPRTLMCINDLNFAMGATGPRHVLRRVHHNTEADRPIFFAESRDKMDKGATFPITCFQPSRIGGYDEVHVIQNVAQLDTYFETLFMNGYFVPKSMNWKLSGHVQKLKQRFGG